MKLTKQNTALLVIDVINMCCKKEFEVSEYKLRFSKIRKMIPKLERFITNYKKEFGGLVVYVNCVKWDKNHVAKNLQEFYKNPGVTYYPPDHNNTGSDFYLVHPEKNDVIITKNTYDGFSNPKLDKILKKNKIKYLIITGIFGDACVHSTVQGGFSKGYNLVFLKDLIETADRKEKQELQKLLKKYAWPKMFGKTINSKEFFTKVVS